MAIVEEKVKRGSSKSWSESLQDPHYDQPRASSDFKFKFGHVTTMYTDDALATSATRIG